MRRKWTKYEKGILTQFFPREGYKGVQKRLPYRTRSSILGAAQRYGLSYGDIPGMVTASSVHPSTRARKNAAHDQIVREARRDGVLEKCRVGANEVYVVPIEWADGYAERLEAQMEDKRRSKTWLTTEEASEIMSCSASALAKAAYSYREGSLIVKAIEGVRFVKLQLGTGGGYRWHPGDIKEAALQYRTLTMEAA